MEGVLWDLRGESTAFMDGGLGGSAMGGGPFPHGEVRQGMGRGSLDIGAHSPLLGAQGV